MGAFQESLSYSSSPVITQCYFLEGFLRKGPDLYSLEQVQLNSLCSTQSNPFASASGVLRLWVCTITLGHTTLMTAYLESSSVQASLYNVYPFSELSWLFWAFCST